MKTKLYSILKSLTKQEILRFSQTMCEHNHTLLEHTSCLEKAIGFRERIGFLDIETSNFSASFGIVVTWAILDDTHNKIYGDFLKDEDFKDKSGHYDKRILESCVGAMQKFDRLIVYWGKDRRFDIPFLRTRALSAGVDFPLYQENIVNDLYDVVKNKFKFGRNSLAAACTQLGINAKDTPMSPQMWVDAVVGRNKKAIGYIYAHNREDVVSTSKLWHRIKDFAGEPNTSI